MVVHDIDIGPPAYIKPKTSVVLARAMASLGAKALLEDPMSEFHFDKVCNCSRKEKAENAQRYSAAADLVTDENDLDTETVEGFAITAQIHLARDGRSPLGNDSESSEDEGEGEGEDADEDKDADIETVRDWLLREDSMELS